MPNIYYWVKLTFSKLEFLCFSWKENLKKCTALKCKKVQGKFAETFFLAFSSSAVFCLQNHVSSAYGKYGHCPYEYEYLVSWYIKSTLYNKFLIWNKLSKK